MYNNKKNNISLIFSLNPIDEYINNIEKLCHSCATAKNPLSVDETKQSLCELINQSTFNQILQNSNAAKKVLIAVLELTQKEESLVENIVAKFTDQELLKECLKQVDSLSKQSHHTPLLFVKQKRILNDRLQQLDPGSTNTNLLMLRKELNYSLRFENRFGLLNIWSKPEIDTIINCYTPGSAKDEITIQMLIKALKLNIPVVTEQPFCNDYLSKIYSKPLIEDAYTYLEDHASTMDDYSDELMLLKNRYSILEGDPSLLKNKSSSRINSTMDINDLIKNYINQTGIIQPAKKIHPISSEEVKKNIQDFISSTAITTSSILDQTIFHTNKRTFSQVYDEIEDVDINQIPKKEKLQDNEELNEEEYLSTEALFKLYN